MKEIYVEWSGPYSYNQIKEKSTQHGYSVKPTDKGLYQIYGSNPLYGDDVLIYIGKTEQPFNKRLNGRSVIIDNQDIKNIKIYLGQIYYDDTSKHLTFSDDISKAESLLIHYHKPANNSSSINSLKYYDEDYRVINTGSYRRLNKEISTTAFTKEMKIFKEIEDILKLLNKATSRKFKIYHEEDGYGFFLDNNVFFGIDYELWSNNITLVLMSEVKYKDITNEKEESWYYKNIGGSVEEIVKKLKEYVNEF